MVKGRQATVRVQAMQFPGYPDPDFIQMTKEAFPDKGIANVEEARVGRRPHCFIGARVRAVGACAAARFF